MIYPGIEKWCQSALFHRMNLYPELGTFQGTMCDPRNQELNLFRRYIFSLLMKTPTQEVIFPEGSTTFGGGSCGLHTELSSRTQKTV